MKKRSEQQDHIHHFLGFIRRRIREEGTQFGHAIVKVQQSVSFQQQQLSEIAQELKVPTSKTDQKQQQPFPPSESRTRATTFGEEPNFSPQIQQQPPSQNNIEASKSRSEELVYKIRERKHNNNKFSGATRVPTAPSNVHPRSSNNTNYDYGLSMRNGLQNSRKNSGSKKIYFDWYKGILDDSRQKKSNTRFKCTTATTGQTKKLLDQESGQIQDSAKALKIAKKGFQHFEFSFEEGRNTRRHKASAYGISSNKQRDRWLHPQSKSDILPEQKHDERIDSHHLPRHFENIRIRSSLLKTYKHKALRLINNKSDNNTSLPENRQQSRCCLPPYNETPNVEQRCNRKQFDDLGNQLHANSSLLQNMMMMNKSQTKQHEEKQMSQQQTQANQTEIPSLTTKYDHIKMGQILNNKKKMKTEGQADHQQTGQFWYRHQDAQRSPESIVIQGINRPSMLAKLTKSFNQHNRRYTTTTTTATGFHPLIRVSGFKQAINYAKQQQQEVGNPESAQRPREVKSSNRIRRWENRKAEQTDIRPWEISQELQGNNHIEGTFSFQSAQYHF